MNLKKEIPFKWRVQNSGEYGATCVAYIDSRDVQNVLDEEAGPTNWQVTFQEIKGVLFCSIGIKDENGAYVWKTDCGTESNVEKQKGEASDAFKRAAVMWSVGRFLYSKKVVKLPTKERNGKYYPYSVNKKKFIYDKEEISAWCEQLSKVNHEENKK